MIRSTTVAIALGIAACAPLPPPGPGPGPGGPVRTSTGDDCAIFAAIAREHYRFQENPPPPLWNPVETDDGGLYRLTCDWNRLGVPLRETYDPRAPAMPGRVRWVKFEEPRYHSRGATVVTAIMHGPLAGMGYECDMVSGFAGWTVRACRSTWVS